MYTCSCKEGLVCSLHWLWDRFHEGTLLSLSITSGIDISKVLGINNITTDVTSVVIQTVPSIITKYISLCKIDYATFTTTGDVAIINLIQCQFNNIKYTPCSCSSCKNGIIDALIASRKQLQLNSTSTTIDIAFQISAPLVINEIIAINNDTVWCRNISGSSQSFYIISICQISSVTLN